MCIPSLILHDIPLLGTWWMFSWRTWERLKSSTQTARFACASAAVKPLYEQLTRIAASTVANQIVNANEQGNGCSGKGIRIRLLNSSNLQKRIRGTDSCHNIGNNKKLSTMLQKIVVPERWFFHNILKISFFRDIINKVYLYKEEAYYGFKLQEAFSHASR